MCDSQSLHTHGFPGARRRFLLRSASAVLSAATVGLVPGAATWAADKAVPKPQNAISPDEALQRLMEGNARYMAGTTRRHDFVHERPALSEGQNPFAAVLGCADSRVAPEYAFDTARGDLFVTRVAGNFVNEDMLGSLEYAVAVLNVPLILVLGHEKCGAVDAAVQAVQHGATYPGMIQSLVTSLKPAVEQAQDKGQDLLAGATEQNIRDSMAILAGRSAIIGQAVQSGKLRLAGGIYRLESGKVDFLA